MLQARQRPDSGGVNRLEERLWPSSPANVSARRAGGSATPIQSIRIATSEISQRMLKNNRSGGDVNWCFLVRFVFLCTASSLYLQTEFEGRN